MFHSNAGHRTAAAAVGLCLMERLARAVVLLTGF